MHRHRGFDRKTNRTTIFFDRNMMKQGFGLILKLTQCITITFAFRLRRLYSQSYFVFRRCALVDLRDDVRWMVMLYRDAR